MPSAHNTELEVHGENSWFLKEPRHRSTGALGRDRQKAEQSLRYSKSERKQTSEEELRGARGGAAVYTSMVWGTAAQLVRCLPEALRKACRLAGNKKWLPLQSRSTCKK